MAIQGSINIRFEPNQGFLPSVYGSQTFGHCRARTGSTILYQACRGTSWNVLRNLARTPLVHNAASALPTQKVCSFRSGAIPLFYILFIHSDTALIMSTTTIVSPSNLSAIPAGALTTNSHETSSERMSKRRYHIPRPATREAERKWQLEQMAGTFRIFAKLGFADGGSGHISVRGAFSIDSVQDDIPTN